MVLGAESLMKSHHRQTCWALKESIYIPTSVASFSRSVDPGLPRVWLVFQATDSLCSPPL